MVAPTTSSPPQRSLKDQVVDAVLLLYFLKEAQPISGRTKAQKTGFFVELALNREGMAGPHYVFYRWDKGPFSRVLWNDLDALTNQGFLIRTPDGYSVTRRGTAMIDLAIPPLKAHPLNDETFLIIDEVLRWCKPRTGEELIQAAYAVELEPAGMPGEHRTVEAIPLGVDIIAPSPDGLHVDDETVSILEEQLAVSADAIRALRSDPEWSRQADERLNEAVNAARRA
jgi:uncharacterized protein YwgA